MMKKLNGKRLNNKGFTLIELLAVVVILAVVMGIAMTSVLSAMNKSRGGSLEDSAMIVANAFSQKYTESLVDGVPSDVYGDVLGSKKGYSFQSDATYYLDMALADTFGLTEGGYAFANSASDVNEKGGKDLSSSKVVGETVENSFVHFDVSTGKFTVCLFANKAGSYYVDNYKLTSAKVFSYKVTVTENGSSVEKSVTAPTGAMFACSDGTRSW